MSRLIVIEGATDGIGKTTQFELLKEKLTKDNKKFYTHHFPSYNTSQAKLVEEYLKGEYGKPEELSPYFINSLYAVDRAVTWNTILKEKYEKEIDIILDRYTTSSLIYQSALIEDIKEKEKFIDYVTKFEYEKIGIPKPDHVIFLTAPFEVITEMRNKRKEKEGEKIKGDIHENNLDFMKKVYDNAIFIANYLNWDIIETCNNKHMKSPKEIHDEIYKILEQK